MSDSSLPLSSKARRTGDQPISFLVQLAMRNPGMVNLAAGLVDESTLPIESTQKLVEQILSDPATARAALQYETTHGLLDLRQAAIEHLGRLDGIDPARMNLSAADVLITTGSQQALYLIGDVLLDPGDIVIAANPCYFVYTATLASLGATVLTVPMDEQGMDVPAAEKLLENLQQQGRLDRVKLIYTTTYFQNPTGLSLSAERREHLLRIARRFSRGHRLLILEDAAYRELRYDGAALPSIKSLDADNRHTILTQTFSKPFAPGIKTGYTAMPADLMQAVLRQKGNHDFGSASLTQHIALQAMRGPEYSRQVDRLCGHYRRKRDVMVAALQEHLPASTGVRWTRPDGGLYVWLTLPEQIDTSRGKALFERCVANGVLYVPGEYCFQPDEQGRIPRNHIRLSFGQAPLEQIATGISRLARSLREVSGAEAARADGAKDREASGGGASDSNVVNPGTDERKGGDHRAVSVARGVPADSPPQVARP